MIINGYTGAFKENVESDMSFHSLRCPQLFIRWFPERILCGEKLIIPYTIIDAQDRKLQTDDNLKCFSKDRVTTYTTTIKLDDNVTDRENPRMWKLTSLDGDLAIEIGPFNEEVSGVHTLSVQCVDCFGVGSTTEYFKFMIEDPNDDPIIIDLDTQNHFTSEFSRPEVTIDSSITDELPSTYFDSSQASTPTNTSTKFVAVKPANVGWVVKKTIIAGYDVTVLRNNQQVLSIRISIPTDNSNTQYKSSYSYGFDVQNWEHYLSKDGSVFNPKSTIEEKLSGEYTLTFFYNSVPLSEYISYPANKVPAAVRKLAALNKIALTRLMEAAKAYAGNKKCILKLPSNLNIVIDYHALDENGNIINYTSGSNTQFPDKFILDMNGSSISVLLAYDISKATAIPLVSNFDTVIKNGKFYGTYKYYDRNTLVEYPCVVGLYGCEFCYFDNCTFAYSMGYDAPLEQDTTYSHRDLKTSCATFTMPFNSIGYVDYNGEQHIVKSATHSNDPIVNEIFNSGNICMRTTDGSADESLYPRGFVSCYWRDNLSTPKYVLPLMGCTLLTNDSHYSINVNGTDGHSGNRISNSTLELSRKSFRTAGDYIYSNFLDLVKADGSSTGLYSKTINRECFVHFYDKNYQFIKTVKAHDTSSVLIPNNAEYVGYSSFGITVNHEPNSLLISKGDYNTYNGLPFLLGCKRSWCSGYRNCIFHDTRTSLFDNHHINQCFAEGCYMYNLAAERESSEGGFSNQTQFVDIEDGGCCDNFFVTDCENVYGRAGFKAHVSYNLCCNNTRNINLMLQKNVYGGQIYAHYGEVLELFGFSAPMKYHLISNNVITRLRLGWMHTACTADKGRTYISESTIRNAVYEYGPDPAGRRPVVYTNKCNVLDSHLNQ